MSSVSAAVQAPREGTPPGIWGIWFFVVSEAMLFFALFLGYFYLQSRSTEWPPPGAPSLPLASTIVNTIFLLASSVTMQGAILSLRRGSQRGLRWGLLATLFLGGLFLSRQVLEYSSLAAEGLTIRAGAFGSLFYTITGFHGAHVLVGLVGLLALVIRAYRVGFAPGRSQVVEGIGVYWHFVDVVWILVFIFLYVLPAAGIAFTSPSLLGPHLH